MARPLLSNWFRSFTPLNRGLGVIGKGKAILRMADSALIPGSIVGDEEGQKLVHSFTYSKYTFLPVSRVSTR